MRTWIQNAFAPIKRTLPIPLANAIRSTVTAIVTPSMHYFQSGHFRSSFAMKAVDRRGTPLPWYTYPAIDFLSTKDFSNRSVLEFGGGQSTLWWAGRCKDILCFEASGDWANRLAADLPPNATVKLVGPSGSDGYIEAVRREIGDRVFDIVIIDGSHRNESIPIAIGALKPGGAIIFDNADGWAPHEHFRSAGFDVVDFFGAAPGVILTECTSIFFRGSSFLFR